MKEPLSNIGFLCPDHAWKPDPRWAKLPMEFFIGKSCKLGFPTGVDKNCQGVVEIEGKECLQGVLNNDPLFAVKWSDGDNLAFNREEIEAIFHPHRDRPVGPEAFPEP